MKNYRSIFKRLVILFLLVSAGSCVEPIEIESQEFESILVVEGIVTDEVKVQEIKLSRSYELDETGPSPLSNAEVSVLSSDGESFDFEEASPGVYKSVIPFGASLGEEYMLQVVTGGNTYESQPVLIDSRSEISNVTSEKTTSQGEEGVVILVSSTSNDTGGKYYKYEYEETYKIQSPYRKFKELYIDENGEVADRIKTREEFTCYNTIDSEELVIANTGGLVGNELTAFPVRFISKENFILSYRYSILVKQLEISAEAYAYYETLKNISESENLFSQYQPGFLEGNINNVNDSGENVIGFFTVATVATGRHFFNYTDYFGEFDNRSSHVSGCNPYVPNEQQLRELVMAGAVEYFQESPAGFGSTPIYTVIKAGCVDCTLYGTNEPPEFWIE